MQRNRIADGSAAQNAKNEENAKVLETSAGCLRSIYPSLGMRQLFGDVTMGQWRHN